MTDTPQSLDMPKMQPISIATKYLKGFAQFKMWMSNRHWNVTENYEYTLTTGETVIIPETFRFDGASIPRWLQWLLSPVGILLLPGLVHDFGYRYDYVWIKSDEAGMVKKSFDGKGQAHWDQVFKKEGLVVHGIKMVSFLSWLALRLGGASSWKKNREKNEADILPKGYVEQT